jgi:hypothetical protein
MIEAVRVGHDHAHVAVGLLGVEARHPEQVDLHLLAGHDGVGVRA